MEYGLSLGSNLGDRLANLSEARRRIAGLPDTCIVAASALYETEPVDVASRFRDLRFLNGALVVESGLDSERLSTGIHSIERELGRIRVADRNAPRPVDIDIIYGAGIKVDTVELTLPHPRWAGRRFVVQPLADIRPDLEILPGGPTVAETLLSLPERPEVILFVEKW